MAFTLKRKAGRGWVGTVGETVKLDVRSDGAAEIVGLFYDQKAIAKPKKMELTLAAGSNSVVVLLTGEAAEQLMKIVEVDPADATKTQVLHLAQWSKTHSYTYFLVEGE
jgi:hypothetical protein